MRVVAGGLRERKKQALRDQLSLAAVRLARERGLAAVRVEDIVDAVGVSRRTFNNYFSSKYDAIVDRHLARVHEAAQALRGRPAEEPLWDALAAVVIAPFEGSEASRAPAPRDYREPMLSVLADPVLEAAILQASVRARSELARAVADRTGTDAERDLFPILVAGAALSAQQAAIDLWLRADPAVDLLTLLRSAFTQVAHGLDSPHPREEDSR
jgi:AcrR family transcriptional regulator